MIFNKQTLLNNLSARTEQHIHLAVNLFQNQPESVLLRPSSARGWSIAQCLDHLNSYGDYYHPLLEKAILYCPPDSLPDFHSGWLGNYFSRIMEPSSTKYNAMKGHIPVAQLEAYEVVATFIHQQEELLSLLHRAATCNLNKRLPISIMAFIRLKTGDVLRFLIAHNERHLQQACRNL